MKSKFRHLATAAGFSAALLAMPALSDTMADLDADKQTQEYQLADLHDMRFCEIILIGPELAEVYNTTLQEEGCDETTWQAIDKAALAARYGAKGVLLNGPKHWMMDAQILDFGAARTLQGITGNWAASLPSSGLSEAGGTPYLIYSPEKKQNMAYHAGTKVFEIVDDEGHVYVLQARGAGLTNADLDTLDDRMELLPAGWSYRGRVLEEALVLDLDPAKARIYAVGDEFYQYYTRIPGQTP